MVLANGIYTETMQVQRRQGVSVYCLSNGATVPEWLGDRAKRNLNKTDDGVRHRVELLQDFEFPAASNKIVQTSDGRYIIAAGIYPPRIRCYDVHDLSMKFERFVTSEIVDLCCLSSDYGKLAILQDDRTIAIHAHYGAHETVRIPNFGRAMVYEATTCELLVASSRNFVYRLNLEEGRFMEPWEFDSSNAAGVCMSLHGQQPLAAVGCDDGVVRFWDTRRDDPTAILNLNVNDAVANKGYGNAFHEITAVSFDLNWNMAVGTARGVVALYDIRSSKPMYIQEHKSGTAIHTTLFHKSHILSSDSHTIKITDFKTDVGDVLVNIEGTGKLASCMVASDDQKQQHSGLILCATDQPKMDAFYVPALGVSPNWCSFLDSITEELEETTNNGKEGTITVFDNYKFVTREELDRLGITNLIGSPLLKAYMHGFFIDTKLFQQVQAVKEPDSYEQYRKAKIKENMAAKSRISAQKVVPLKTTDSRFGELLTNPDFAVDEATEDFKLRHPSGVSKRKRTENFDSDDDDDNVMENDDHDDRDEPEKDLDESEASSVDEEDSVGMRNIHDEEYASKHLVRNIASSTTKSKKDDMNQAAANSPRGTNQSDTKRNVVRRRKYVLEEADDVIATSGEPVAALTMAQRVALATQEERENPTLRVNQSGRKEVSFVPKAKKRTSRGTVQEEEGASRLGSERRGIKDLGLKNPLRSTAGRGRKRA